MVAIIREFDIQFHSSVIPSSLLSSFAFPGSDDSVGPVLIQSLLLPSIDVSSGSLTSSTVDSICSTNGCTEVEGASSSLGIRAALLL